jgi:protein-tyrosine phosphatase
MVCRHGVALIGQTRRVHVCFVCTGNICRSPVAALVLTEHLRRAGLADRVRVTSAGTGPWHVGEPADPRARRVLADRGYPAGHVAAQVDDDHLSADLLVAMDTGHEAALRRLLPGAGGRVVLFRSFEPDAIDQDAADQDVPDPYYGDPAGFVEVIELVEAGMPGLVQWIRTHLA